jgi:predicted RNase H-like nuclease (RuvC/YqgF family)
MKCVLFFLLAVGLACLLPGFLPAQEEGYRPTNEMSALEVSFKQQYDQLSIQIADLQNQMEDLKSIKAQVNSIIDQVQSKRSASFTQETDKYRQLEVLVPVVVRFSQDLENKQTQMNQLVSRRDAVKARVLQWRGTLPPWWME